MTKPAVALVTVTYNSEEVLPDFLASVQSQQVDDAVLIVIDNASTDGTRSALERGPLPSSSIVIYNERNLGVAAGNNQGIREALSLGASYVLLINNDTSFGPTFVTDLLAEVEHGDIHVVTPIIDAIEPPGAIWYQGGELRRRVGFFTRDRVDVQPSSRARVRTEYAPTCCLLVHRSVFEKIGLMDERFFVYFDDTDFMVRLADHDIGVFVTPSARMLHKVSALTGGRDSDFAIRYASRNWVFINRKHRNARGRLTIYAYITAWTIARWLVGPDTLSTFRKRWQGYAEGLRISLDDPEDLYSRSLEDRGD